MHPAVFPLWSSFGVSVVLAALLAWQSGKTRIHWVLLFLLLAAGLWTGGAAWRYMASDLASIQAAYRIMFLGIALAPGTWLFLCGLFSRVEWFEVRPAAGVFCLLPGACFYLAFITNDAHGLVARIGADTFDNGPLMRAFLAWCYGQVAVAIGLMVRHARFLAGQAGPAQAAVAISATVAPLVASAAYQFGWIQMTWDPTGAALGVSGALLFPLVFRLGFLEPVPLVRRDVFDHLREGVMVADAEGRVVDANPAAERLLGGAVGRIRGQELRRSLEEIVEPVDHGSIAMALADPGPDGPRVLPEVSTLSGRHLRLSCGLLGDAGFVVVLHDRTEERKSERALRQAQKLESVGFLAAGVAHEVNNPLAFVHSNLAHIQAACESLESIAKPADADIPAELAELPEVVAETLEGVERISTIVDQMRRLSRDAAEENELVDLNDVLHEAIRFASLHRGSRHVEVVAELATELPAVRGNRSALVQVVLNLLLNARQALAEGLGNRIRILTRADRAGVVAVVADDGPGIPEDIRERVFDPFFTTKAPDEGTGLGLAIAWDIVREHRGSIDVTCPPEGGTEFKLVFPAAP
ncbi:MAG: PAS domain-containing protein [bacterium]|nr:PAS domain-containing protein [bacterium]